MMPFMSLRRARLHAIAITAVVAAVLLAMPARADEARSAFRPCIDPSNLPFANDKGEGFENRIAALFARQLALPVEPYTFPQRMNFIRNTLRYRLPGEDFRCDVVMSVPAEYDQVSTTRPYYRSSYALVYRRGHGLDRVKSGHDFLELPAAVLRKLRVGVHDRSPAATWLAKHGLEQQAKLYPMMSPDPDRYPGEIVEKELVGGAIDAAIVWGPIAGYYAKRAKADLAVVPLASEPGVKFDYAIAMGVRFGEREWKDTVDKLIVDNQAAIDEILVQYGVPLVNERGEPVRR